MSASSQHPHANFAKARLGYRSVFARTRAQQNDRQPIGMSGEILVGQQLHAIGRGNMQIAFDKYIRAWGAGSPAQRSEIRLLRFTLSRPVSLSRKATIFGEPRSHLHAFTAFRA